MVSTAEVVSIYPLKTLVIWYTNIKTRHFLSFHLDAVFNYILAVQQQTVQCIKHKHNTYIPFHWNIVLQDRIVSGFQRLRHDRFSFNSGEQRIQRSIYFQQQLIVSDQLLSEKSDHR